MSQPSSSIPLAVTGQRHCRACVVAIVLVALALAHSRPANLWAADPPAAGTGKTAAGTGKTAAGKKGAKAKPARAGKPAAPKPAAGAKQVEPARLMMPQVVLSDAHAKTCLVKVGDAMPDAQLKDLAGRRQTLSALLGKRLTVVLFWQSTNPYALEELADLGPAIGKPFADAGVQVIAIDERESADLVGPLAKRLAITFPVLLDSDGSVLASVATRRLPRTYLLDAQGKILWFDIEYSASTRRDLRDAIRVTLNAES